MAFIKKGNSSYLEVTNAPKLVRPLYKEAITKWCHSIPSCKVRDPSGKEKTLRKFRMIDAEFSSWLEENADPLWGQLDSRDQTNQQGIRKDFPKRPIHVLPVWDTSLNNGQGDVRIVKQGNQFYEEMIKWDDQGGDVTHCDWMCWTEGEGRTKKYQTTRQDVSAFQCPIDQESLQRKCVEAMNQALMDLLPFRSEEDMLKHIHGESGDQTQQVANQVQQQMPAYQAGGPTTGPQLATQAQLPAPAPAPAPAAQQPPEQQVQPNWQAPQTATDQPPPQPQQQTQPTWGAGGVNVNSQGQAPVTQQVFVPPQQEQGPPAWAPQGPAVQQQPASQPPVQATQQQWAPPVEQEPVAQVQQEVQNAPVSVAPVYPTPAPVHQNTDPTVPQHYPSLTPALQNNQVTQHVSSPSEVVVEAGKYKGRTLGYVFEIDQKYLNFLKGNQKHLAPAIEAILASSPPQRPAANQPNIPTQTDDVDEEATRQQLIQNINDRCLNIQDFQGPGIVSNMMPFLENTIGTPNFSDAPLSDLVKLDSAINAQYGA